MVYLFNFKEFYKLGDWMYIGSGCIFLYYLYFDFVNEFIFVFEGFFDYFYWLMVFGGFIVF